MPNDYLIDVYLNEWKELSEIINVGVYYGSLEDREYVVFYIEDHYSHNEESLRLAMLYLVKRLGLNKVILGCYKENIGSAKTIIKNGEVLVREEDNLVNLNDCYSISLISKYYEIML